jgi:anaerobic magnesium-protoporphyrin IX monomethyl ester cyclase
MESKEQLDQLYNKHVKRFYTDHKWRKKFRKRIWEHRRSIWYFLRHLPSFLQAKRTFEPEKE